MSQMRWWSLWRNRGFALDAKPSFHAWTLAVVGVAIILDMDKDVCQVAVGDNAT
jgi:hypothetical protein